MSGTHIDNSSADFAGRIDKKPLRYRIAHCFHPSLFFPLILFIGLMYLNYKFITHPELLSTPLIYAFIVAVIGQIAAAILFKMTSDHKITTILKEIFC